MPIFRVKSEKISPAKKNLHEYTRGVSDKYEVCIFSLPTQRLYPHLRDHPQPPALAL